MAAGVSSSRKRKEEQNVDTGIDYYGAQRLAEDAARDAKYDAVRESRAELEAEIRNRRESEHDLREAMSELETRLGILERSFASVCTGQIDDRGILQHDGDTCPVHERGVA